MGEGMSDGAFEPVVVENPDGVGPIVIVCDHASNRIPAEYASFGFEEDALQTHIAWDPGALAVARLLAADLDAPLVWPDVSRLVIDCNRAADVPSLIVTESEGRKVEANRGLSDEERKRRLDTIHGAYHAAIEACLARRQAAHMLTSLIAIHSYTPVFLGKARPWQVGILFDDDRRLADVLIGALKADPSADRRHQRALFSRRPRLLHGRAPCPAAGPSGGDDRNSQRRDWRRGRPATLGRPPRQNISLRQHQVCAARGMPWCDFCNRCLEQSATLRNF